MQREKRKKVFFQKTLFGKLFFDFSCEYKTYGPSDFFNQGCADQNPFRAKSILPKLDQLNENRDYPVACIFANESERNI